VPFVPIDVLLDRIAPEALGICARLAEHGHRGWIVGGCVRDLCLGTEAMDWDIATDAAPAEVIRLFPRAIPTGIEHGTVSVLVHGVAYEVTTLRGETTYSDGRRPDSVVFVKTIEEDLARRDFTVNAIAIDPVARTLIDPWQGLRDLDARSIRAVGDPLARFSEDGLRPLRAARFCATLQFEIDPATLAAIEPTLPTYRKVSAERIRDEWVKSMAARQPSRAFEVMRTSGMLAITAPELLQMVGCEQNRHHAYDVWEHTMRCVDACRADPVLRMAALLHDVGKPLSRAVGEKTADYTFHRHEVIGAELALEIAARLRFSNQERDRIVHLVAHHLIQYADDWTDSAVRRFVRRVGREHLGDLYELARADAHAKGPDADDSLRAIDLLDLRVRAVVEAKDALTVRELEVSGHDVMQQLGIGPGPRVGEILEALLERVIEDPTLNRRETLLELAGRVTGER
jgi:tRNA nucleotidyltransferase (CCA-adding enzyme)